VVVTLDQPASFLGFLHTTLASLEQSKPIVTGRQSQERGLTVLRSKFW
jgi:hypothetical protein